MSIIKGACWSYVTNKPVTTFMNNGKHQLDNHFSWFILVNICCEDIHGLKTLRKQYVGIPSKSCRMCPSLNESVCFSCWSNMLWMVMKLSSKATTYGKHTAAPMTLSDQLTGARWDTPSALANIPGGGDVEKDSFKRWTGVSHANTLLSQEILLWKV